LQKVKIILVVFLLIILSACSVKEAATLENQIKDIMVEHDIEFDTIWHLEIKEDVVIVFYEKDESLSLGFISDNKGDREWITGGGSIDLKNGGYIATAEMGLPFYITAVVNPDETIKGISVSGENAKLVQVSPQDKVWFAFTDKPANGVDIEEIR
jgi:hypothetical protein